MVTFESGGLQQSDLLPISFFPGFPRFLESPGIFSESSRASKNDFDPGKSWNLLVVEIKEMCSAEFAPASFTAL